MSNHLAIAAVTAMLKKLLREGLQSDGIAPAEVTSLRPDSVAGAADSAANVYLYGITPNPALRNMDLPTHDANGRPIQTARVALNLHYLISFLGDEAKFEPQIRIGSAVRTLHANAIFERARIRDLIESASGMADPGLDAIIQSGLEDSVESIKFTPTPIPFEELSRLWSNLFQAPYALSMAFEASVVLIERPGPTNAPLPVRERRVHALPVSRPTIEKVVDARGVETTFEEGDVALIIGHGLRGEFTQVRLGVLEIDPAELPAEMADHRPWLTDTRIVLPLAEPPFASGALRPGLHALRVVHRFAVAEDEEPRRVFESNAQLLTLRPRIDFGPITTEQIVVRIAPRIGAAQRVELILTEVEGEPPLTMRFPAPKHNGAAAGDGSADEVTFATSGLRPGSYVIRVRVDGAESPPDLDQPQTVSAP